MHNVIQEEYNFNLYIYILYLAVRDLSTVFGISTPWHPSDRNTFFLEKKAAHF